GHLQLQIILIGPEPGHFVVDSRFAEDRERRRLALAERIRHGLEPKASAIEQARVIAAVADGEDVRVGGAGEFIDDDAVLGRQSCGGSVYYIRVDYDAAGASVFHLVY